MFDFPFRHSNVIEGSTTRKGVPMNVYELATDDLIREFMNACSRAGTSNSGLLFSSSAGSDLDRANELCAAVIARIDRAEPPVMVGMKVEPICDIVQPSTTNGWERRGSARGLPEILTVKTLHYMKNGEWEYTFAEMVPGTTAHPELLDDGDKTWRELRPLRFKSEDFKPAVLLSASN